MFKSFKVDNARRVEFEDKFIQIPKSKWAYLRNNIDTFHTTGGEGTPSEQIPIVNVSEWNKTVCGKNLFDKNSIVSSGTAAITIGTTSISGSGYRNQLISIVCPPNTEFTIHKTGGTSLSVASSTIPANELIAGSTLLNVAGGINTSPASVTITTAATAKYLIVQYYHGAYDTTLTAEQIRDTLQIELGNTATAYKAYNGNTYPYRLEDVNGVLHEAGDLPDGTCDTVNWETGEFVERKGVKVLDGTENWIVSTINTNTIRFNYIQAGRKAGTAVKADKFPYFNSLGGVTIPDAELITSGTTIAISVNKSRLATIDVDGFKTWLGNNPVTVQYALAEPVTYQIKQYGSTFPYNEKPIQVEDSVCNVFSDKNVTMNFKAVSY